MAERKYRYIITGGGLAGFSAAKAIRERDGQGPVLVIGKEPHRPYDRPPLTKKLWSGKKKVEDIFLGKGEFFEKNGIELRLGTEVLSIDPARKEVVDSKGLAWGYEKLLLATGGSPNRLDVPGANLDEICYYRTLDDYSWVRARVSEGSRVLVVGGGFIGSEIAASLNGIKARVTMVFPSRHIADRVFPLSLGMAIQKAYMERGVEVFAGLKPAFFEKKGGRLVTGLSDGREVESDIVIAGVGITPALELARSAGLATGNGIKVNEYLETSVPGIFAAGDNALFPYMALGRDMRVEHWDNAMVQGEYAGRNMAGERVSYDHMPYFFSDLFEFGYEAVGEVSSSLETFADWQKEHDTGVVYYLRDRKVRGVMLCNVWEKVDWARTLIKSQRELTPSTLKRAAG